jgi:phosphoribosylformylglycinamidine synthase I
MDALASLGAEPVLIRHDDRELPELNHVIVPGGFSYGDYLRAGALAAHAPIMDALQKAVSQQSIQVLGICNGFQILCERGILPGALARNHSGMFRCSWEWVEVVRSPAYWPQFSVGMRFRLPIAHADGAFLIGAEERARFDRGSSLFLRYIDGHDGSTPYNPNGSLDAIAGITDGPVMALMPHPERAMEPWLGSDDGRLFLSLWMEGGRG